MEKETKEPDVEISTDEVEAQDTPSDVTVDLNAKTGSKEPEKPKEDKGQADYSKLNNTIAYQTRKLEQAMRKIQELETNLSLRPKEVVKEVQQITDEIDEIAQRDWKLGVKKVVEKDIEQKVQEMLQKRDQAIAETTRQKTAEVELDKSKNRVLERYPSINDDSSDEARLYLEVINEDNSLLQNIHGPEIAMYRMEEKMKSMGKIPASSRPVVDREVSRLARAGASNITGRQPSPSGKITLSKEQKEFCEHYNIPFEQYAKNLKAQNANGGV